MIGSAIMFMDFLLIFGIKDVKPKRPPPQAIKLNGQDPVVKEKSQMLKVAFT